MTITLDDLYAWDNSDCVCPPGIHPLSDGLCLLGLDACSSLYEYLCLPTSFDQRGKRVLQTAMRDFDVNRYNTEEKMAALVLSAFQHYEQVVGTDAACVLGEWMRSSDRGDAYFFVSDLSRVARSIESGDVKATVPPRLERFLALHALFEDNCSYPEEELLAKDKLKTAWDKKNYAGHYDADPDWELNNWEPDASASLRVSLIHARIAWENAMRHPTVDAAEIETMGKWVDTHLTHVENYTPPPANPKAMFLPQRLRQEYEKRGMIRA